MRRSAKIYIIALIWGATLIQLFFNSRVKIEEEVIQTFATLDIMEYETDILIWGEYGDSSYGKDTIKNILVNTATEFGITDGYVLSNRDEAFVSQMLLIGTNREQGFSFQFVTDRSSDKSFLLTNFTVQGRIQDNTESVRMLENFYEDIGVEYRKSVSVRGKLAGRIDTEDVEKLANNIFEEIAGRYVNGSFLSELKNDISADMPFTYIAYGYTKELPLGTYMDEKKVNVRITFDYDPIERMTDICVKFMY